MAEKNEIRTKRLLLREWLPADREPFAAMSSDPRVMEHLPSVLTRQESDAVVDRVESHFRQHGFGAWAVEIPDLVPFAGWIGLLIPKFQAHFTPCVEIGWRLAAEHWNRGYATEGAKAALHYGFDVLGLTEIVSFTVPANVASIRVMEKIGMARNPAEDFDHPSFPEGHRLRRHVLYRMRKK